jgi:hypothetical protein
MAKPRRPHLFSGTPDPDSASDAHLDLYGEIALPAPGGAAPNGGRDFVSLLPDVQASEHDRRRERRLVEAACRGEESAIEALYRTHYDTIYRYVILRVGSPSAAEDVTSQVFLGMVRGLGRYRDEGKPFVAWLYGIAQKQIAFFQRSQGRSPSPVDLDAAAELMARGAARSHHAPLHAVIVAGRDRCRCWSHRGSGQAAATAGAGHTQECPGPRGASTAPVTFPSRRQYSL